MTSKLEKLVHMKAEGLVKLQNPIQKAIYKDEVKKEENQPKKRGRPKGPPLDKNKSLICDICNRKYTYTNKWHHDKTLVHISYAQMNDRLKKALLGDF
jgi:hypothetical protein